MDRLIIIIISRSASDFALGITLIGSVPFHQTTQQLTQEPLLTPPQLITYVMDRRADLSTKN